jgi:hypothetical protein
VGTEATGQFQEWRAMQLRKININIPMQGEIDSMNKGWCKAAILIFGQRSRILKNSTKKPILL